MAPRRLSQFSIISGAVIGAFVLGLILAPSLRQAGPANTSPPQGKSAANNRTSAITDAPGNSPSRTRVKDREPAKKTDEPRVSIRVKTTAARLQEVGLGARKFMELEDSIEQPLVELEATKTEIDDIKDLVKKSKDEIYAAEKAHFKFGLVTPDHVEIDASGMRQPISDIIGRLQDGIRTRSSSGIKSKPSPSSVTPSPGIAVSSRSAASIE